MSVHQLLQIDVGAIEQAPDGLRKVNHEDEGFKEIVQSVKARGVLNAISVIDKGDGTYILVDGLHRFTAACMAGLPTIPAQVLDEPAEEIPELQMEANLHKVETKPMEYTRQLQRVMMKHPERSLEEQARRVKKSIGWVRDRLSLNVFEGRAAELIEEGTLKVSNAYALAKIARLAPGEVDDWLDRATDMAPEDFIPEALQREKELKAAAASGKKTSDAPASGPAVKLRKLGDIKSEYSRAKGLEAQKRQVGGTDAAYAAGYLAAFDWALSQDAGNVEAWKKAEAERKAMKEAKAREREAEKAAKAKAEGKLSLDDLVPKKLLHPEEVAAE